MNSHSDQKTVFSLSEHTARNKRPGRIKQINPFSYRFLKVFLVSVISFGLITGSMSQALAGYMPSRPSGKTIQKRVNANARAGNFNTRSNSRASVRNDNSIRINQGGGGIRLNLARNNGNNRNNRNGGNDKKVIRKVIRKDIDVSVTENINKTIVHKDITVTKPYYNYCPDNCYSYPTYPVNNNYNYNTNKNYTNISVDGYYYYPGY